MKKILIVCLALSAMASFAQTGKLPSMVSVTGEGEASIIPDQVLIQVSAETEGKEAAQVKSSNDQIIQDVLIFLRNQNIAEKEIKTEYVTLTKNYNYNTKTYSYRANQTLSVLVKDLTKYEVVMSGLLKSGINRISNVQFKSSRMDAIKKEARIKALIDAKNKATLYAETLGQKIGKVAQISEQGSTNGQPPIPMYRMAMSESSADNGQTLAPGEMLIRATIDVSYYLD